MSSGPSGAAPGGVLTASLRDTTTGRSWPVTAAWDVAGKRLAVRGATTSFDIAPDALEASVGGWQGELVVLSWRDDAGAWALTAPAAAAIELGAVVPEPLARQLRDVAATTAAQRKRARRGPRILLSVGLALIAAFGLAFALRRPILDRIVRGLPMTVDVAVGNAIESQLALGSARVAAGPAADAVARVGERIGGAVRSAGLPFRFRLVRDATSNAFAAPGGLIVVNTGLLAATTSERELAGVLAHEAAHVLERHALRQLIHRAGLAAAVRLLLGSPDRAASALASAALDISALQFSREQELAADAAAVEILRTARLPADGLASFFERLADQPGQLPPILSTHPAAGERAARVSEAIRSQRTWPTEPPGLDWDQVRQDAAALH
jgi:predicted Zn-dependent protease